MLGNSALRFRTRPTPAPVVQGQESVWDYPRPAVLRANQRHLVVRCDGEVVAECRGGFQVLETSHPPTYYLPLADVRQDWLVSVQGGGSICEWKGAASYFDVVTGTSRRPRACWTYHQPSAPFEGLKGHVAFYAASMDACFVDDDVVIPQPGAFYGGWITRHVAGPFKGQPGSEFW